MDHLLELLLLEHEYEHCIYSIQPGETPNSSAFALIYSIAMVADSFITIPKLPVKVRFAFSFRDNETQ